MYGAPIAMKFAARSLFIQSSISLFVSRSSRNSLSRSGVLEQIMIAFTSR